jgi:hypothetical protein
MSRQNRGTLPPAGFARAAGWLIALAAVFTALIFVYWMTGVDPKTDPKGFASGLTSVLGFGTDFLYTAALIGLIFGMFALYATIMQGESARLALVALVCSVAGVGVLMAAEGASSLGGAVAGRVYLDGYTDAAQVMVKLSGGSFGQAVLIAFIIASCLAAVGALLFGIAIWKSGVLPHVSGVLFALGFVLLVLTVPFVSQIGEIMLIIAGVQIARTGRSNTVVSHAEMPQVA